MINKKNILIIATIVVLIGILIFVLAPKERGGNNESQPQTGERDYTRTGLIEYITRTGGKEYERHSLTEGGLKNLIITYYQSERGSTFVERDRKGILVFEDTTDGASLIWESHDPVYATIPLIRTFDLDNDGVYEILVRWQYDRAEDLYVYRWADEQNEFALISPTVEIKWSTGKISEILGFNSDVGEIVPRDVDDDGIFEIIVPATRLLHDPEARGDYQRIFKWNGSEYYLWKETTESL